MLSVCGYPLPPGTPGSASHPRTYGPAHAARSENNPHPEIQSQASGTNTFADQPSKLHAHWNVLKIRLCTADSACCGNGLVKGGMDSSICFQSQRQDRLHRWISAWQAAGIPKYRLQWDDLGASFSRMSAEVE